MRLIPDAPGGPKRFDGVEFALVVTLAFGYMILQSIAELMQFSTVGHFGGSQLFDDEHLTGMIRYELAVVPMITLILMRGGWRLADFGLGPTWRRTLAGVALGVAGLGVLGALHTVAGLFLGAEHSSLAAIPHPPPGAEPAVWLFLLACVVNPLFEEIFVSGYVVRSLSGRFGTNVAIHASTLIRMLYHLYQGPFAFVWCGVYGLLAAHVYSRWRLLWPLVVAHAMHDAIGLVFHYGALPP